MVEEEEDDIDVGEVIGIITLEDVNDGGASTKEIVDETNEFIDVANKIRVVAAAQQLNRGGSLVCRIATFKNLQMGLSKQVQHAIKKVRQVENEARQNRLAALGMNSGNLSVPNSI